MARFVFQWNSTVESSVYRVRVKDLSNPIHQPGDLPFDPTWSDPDTEYIEEMDDSPFDLHVGHQTEVINSQGDRIVYNVDNGPVITVQGGPGSTIINVP